MRTSTGFWSLTFLVKMFRKRQSSDPVTSNGLEYAICMQGGPNVVASLTFSPHDLAGAGGRNLLLPIGGSANGIPRNCWKMSPLRAVPCLPLTLPSPASATSTSVSAGNTAEVSSSAASSILLHTTTARPECEQLTSDRTGADQRLF